MSQRILCMSLLVSVSSATVANPSRTIDIPAQPLATALRQFADQVGFQLAVETSLTSGKTSRAIKGEVSTQDALEKLLGDSGLIFELLDGRIVAILPSIVSTKFGKTSYAASSILLAQNELANPQTKISRDRSTVSRDTGTLEEVVVTAQFRAQNLQDTPLAITAMSGEMIEQRGYAQVTDLASSAPNILFTPSSGTYSGATLYIRGVGQFNSNIAFEPGVGVYIDDLYYGSMVGADFNLMDLGRVEILRGPQGTLAGANSIGGAVKLYTAQPTSKGGGYATVGYGSNDIFLARSALDIPLVEDKLFLRVSGGFRREGGFVDIIDFACAKPSLAGTLPTLNPTARNCLLGRAGGKTTITARTNFRWLPTYRMDISFTADANVVDSQPNGQILYTIGNVAPLYQTQQMALHGVVYDERFMPPPGKYISYATFTDNDMVGGPFDPRPYSKNYALAGTINYQFSDHLSLKSITGYIQSEGYGPADTDASPLRAGHEQMYWDVNQFTQELRMNGDVFNSAFEWTVGGFYYDSNRHQFGRVNAATALVPFRGLFFDYDETALNEKKAAYATAIWHVTDKLNVTGGYRYSTSKLEYTQERTDPKPPSLVTLTGIRLGAAPRQQADRSDYRIAVDYRWTDNFMTYAQFATGFKDGGVNPTSTTAAGQTPFGVEKLKAYEVGLKSNLFDRRLRFNMTTFLSDYTDLQIRAIARDNIGTLQSLTTNVGAATIKGVELESEWAPVDELLVTASAGYLDFQYDDLGTAAMIANGPCIKCTNAFTPQYTAYLAGQYTLNLGKYGTLTPRLSGTYQSKVYSETANVEQVSIPGRWIAEARATWAPIDSKWEIAMTVSNLFDKFYVLNIRGDARASQGFASATMGRPREILFTARRAF